MKVHILATLSFIAVTLQNLHVIGNSSMCGYDSKKCVFLLHLLNSYNKSMFFSILM